MEINNIMAKYWKQGFYDEPQEGSVEITEEYWQELLDGQSSGKEIRENENLYISRLSTALEMSRPKLMR